ncbi:hypothetical protein D6745_05125 [Candidatus Woesearchaeota archaeon]|nr:MAG: hypothetical protein D6745_05125 [Candidatus Woesearchaeota archaeon]
MEKFQLAQQKAKKNLQVADHMLTVTYPMVKDPKLLASVMENLFLSLTNAMASLLYLDRMYKRVPPFQDTFESKFMVFRDKCARRYNIQKEYLDFILEVKNLVLEHKKSPVEFSRKDKFVICSDNYSIKAISVEKMKSYVAKAKMFVHQINILVEENDELFGRRGI